MKKIIVLLAVCFIIFNRNQSIQAATAEQEDVVYNNIEEPVDLHILKTGNLLEYKDHMLFKNNNYTVEIKGQFISCCDDGIITYVMHTDEGINKITKINKKDTKSVIIDQEYEVQKIKCQNNKIYLFGLYNNFSVIMEYTEDLEFEQHRMYFENANITFYDALFYDDKWYVLGLKNGHSVNSQVENIGNYNDTKTILLIIDSNFNIQSIKYFNHYSSYEYAKLLDVNNEFIYYYFEIDGVKYLYKSDLNFTKNYLLEKNKAENVLIDVNGDYLLFNNNNTLKMKTPFEELDLGTYNRIYKYLIQDGKLNIYHYSKTNLYVKKISEYHINKLDPIIITYQKGSVDFDKNLNNTMEIDIKSYFSKVDVLCNSDFSKNVSGKYNIELLIVRPNHDNIKLSSVVEIKPYLNIVDGGVYCTGQSLIFLGNGTLNGTKINSGHNILSSGEYKLEISNNLGIVEEYNFIIVDNYYIRSNDKKEADLVVSLESQVEIKFDVGDIIITDIIVNDENVNFIQEGKMLNIFLDKCESSGIKEYVINKIITESYEYKVEQKILVNVLKPTPKINIVENNEAEPSFSIFVEDSEQTIKYLEVIVTKDLVENKYYYFFNENFVIDNNNFDNGCIDIYLCFELGDGIVRKEKLLSLDANFKEVTKLFTFNSIIETEKIKQIDIKINSKSIKKLNSLIVNDMNIVGKYATKTSYTNIIISMSLTIIIILSVVIIIIVKKRRIKKA